MLLLCAHVPPIAAAGGPERQLVTFVDLLSSSERFSEFLHTAQRLRMVIPLNRLRNATLFVPTNAALQRYRDELGKDGTRVTGSIYRGVSDSQAWYHVIGEAAIGTQDLGRGTMVWQSLSLPDSDSSVTASNDAEKQPYGIMLKTQLRNGGSVVANGVPVLAQNFSCAAGTVYQVDGVLEIPPTIRERLHSLGESVAGTAGSADEYSAVVRLLAAAGWADILARPASSSHLAKIHTLWAFSNREFSRQYSYAQRSYLLNGPTFAADDEELRRAAVADAQTVASRLVSNVPISIARLGAGTHSVPSLDRYANLTVIVEESHGALVGRVDGQQLGQTDVIARDGIVHSIEQLQRPDGLAISPQKALVGLNATAFVRLLKDSGLGDYIDGTRPDRKLTLLAPTNHAMDEAFGYDLDDDTPDSEGNTQRSPRDRQREWALYHVVDGQYDVAELAQTPLVRTKLASAWTGGRAQVVKAQVDQAHRALAKHVSFNGADNILLEPEVIGNTTIYLLSSPMPTPPRLIGALIQDLDLSLFVAAMGASNTVDEIQNEAGVTVLAPVVSAFSSLGLVWSYLSLPGDLDARTDLSRLIKSHVLTRPVYSDEIPMHTDSSADMLVVEALNGNKVGLFRTPHGIFVSVSQGEQPPTMRLRVSDTASRLASVGDTSTLRISESDMLLQTGVAHVLESGLILPLNVEITSAKLLRGMRAHVFTELLQRFNLTYVLEDPRAEAARTARSGDGDNEDPRADVIGYSLLVPSDKSWRENAAYRELTRREHDDTTATDDSDNPWRNATTSDITRYLDRLVRLHVIPIVDARTRDTETSGGQLSDKQLALADRKSYPTLLDDVKLRAHEFASDRFSLQLEGAPFYQAPGGVPFVSVATVVRSGAARTGAVFELDTLLRLPPVNAGPGGWKRVAWNAAVWLTGIGMGSGLLGVSGYWVRQWWTRADYQSL
ncbi:hypothetical protein LPJ70_002018 [Coemansia sp. RSA 2708]|nr:hypothetical protein LPJ70_002018 [Coemansia sp. RSA 2708]